MKIQGGIELEKEYDSNALRMHMKKKYKKSKNTIISKRSCKLES